MSENEPLINFNCPCGKPVAAPASLAGQKLHCPYEGCDTIVTAPGAPPAPAGDASPPKAADGKPRQPRMPPPKGLKGGAAKAAGAAAPAAARRKPAATPASTPAAAEPAAPVKAKKNALFFVTCSVVTLGILLVVMNRGRKPAVAPAPTPPSVTRPTPAPAPVPADPAPPLEQGARKPRQQIDDMEALNARLAGNIEEKKKEQRARFNALVAEAESGDLDAMLDLAEAYAEGEGTTKDTDKARSLLRAAGERNSSRAWYRLAELERRDDPEKAVAYLLKGARIVALSKGSTRDERLAHYLEQLRELEAENAAAEVEAMMSKPVEKPAEPPAGKTPAPAVEPAPAIPGPAPDAPAPAPAIPEPAPGIPEPAPGIPEPGPAVPEPAPPAIPEPPALTARPPAPRALAGLVAGPFGRLALALPAPSSLVGWITVPVSTPVELPPGSAVADVPAVRDPLEARLEESVREAILMREAIAKLEAERRAGETRLEEARRRIAALEAGATPAPVAPAAPGADAARKLAGERDALAARLAETETALAQARREADASWQRLKESQGKGPAPADVERQDALLRAGLKQLETDRANLAEQSAALVRQVAELDAKRAQVEAEAAAHAQMREELKRELEAERRKAAELAAAADGQRRLREELTRLASRLESAEPVAGPAAPPPEAAPSLPLTVPPGPAPEAPSVIPEPAAPRELDPEFERLIDRAADLLKQDKGGEAVGVLDTALARQPGHPDALYRRAVAHYKAGANERARTDAEAVLATRPRHAPTLGLLSLLLWSAGEHAKARETIERAIAEAPGDAQLHNHRGIILNELEDHAGAISALETAVKLEPDNGDSRYNLAALLVAHDPARREEARRQYEAALKLGLARDERLEKRIYE